MNAHYMKSSDSMQEGHFSKYGNKIAGKIISKELDKIL